ncbi:DUF2572 family protein [Necropsobacter massiliensis]|uniref:DUF2572 family protein n=1 Tax=Necropsobacter massiliensis TaxID=1400001 RepID=UPI000595C94F|nr:DUF2572 family protein [Necropsobacter massiliensis]
MAYRGIMTLTLLMLLSALLVMFMRFDDDLLRLYSALPSQRQVYLQAQLELQHISHEQAHAECNSVPLDNDDKTRRIRFENNEKNHRTFHFVWCERLSLFQQAPKKALNLGGFEQYLAPELEALFAAELHPPPPSLPSAKTGHLYWFNRQQTEWELNGNIYAVIVAQGDLLITGKGKISGALITGGKFHKSEQVQITYHKETVTNIVRQYSRWQLAEKSWYDVEPL